MFQDLRFGLRMLRRNPGLSLLAILCLTLGIGATTACYVPARRAIRMDPIRALRE